MALKLMVAVIVTGFSILGCAQNAPPGGSALASCNENQCKITVTVTGNCSAATDIKVDPDTMPVSKEFHQVKMHWDIETPGFKFAPEPNAITFTAPPIPPAGEFHDGNVTANGTKYNITNANTASSPINYKYNVRLLRADGSACTPKDPLIRNGA